MRRKNEMVEISFNFLKNLKLKDPGMAMFLRMDNAGENISLKNKLEKEGIDIKIEFTTPNTPEQNGQVERSFATLWGRVRAMLNHSGVTASLRDELWAECASTATKLCNILSRKERKSPNEMFYGKEAIYAKDLRIFGEIGIKISRTVGIPEKILNKGNECIFLGYEANHPKDAYRVLDLKNKTVMITRNVRWLGRSYGDHFKLDSPKTIQDTELESSDNEEVILKPFEKPIPKKKEIVESSIVTRSKALIDVLEDEESESSEDSDDAILFTTEETTREPNTFEEAYLDLDPERRSKWRSAIQKEINSMESCNVWTLIRKSTVPKGRKLIGNRWVFKEKRDGVFRARLVALGYSQIPGVDYMDNFSPVVAYSSFRVILLMIQKLGMEAWSLDVETAFLNGDLQEEIYMHIPKGYAEIKGGRPPEEMALRLNKSIYGLVQAARQWHKRFEEEIIKIGFLKNEVDPCVFMKQDFCILCIYVNDGILTGSKRMMNEAIEGLKGVFSIKFQKNIEDFLGCEIHERKDGLLLTQRRIIDKLIKENKKEGFSDK